MHEVVPAPPHHPQAERTQPILAPLFVDHDVSHRPPTGEFLSDVLADSVELPDQAELRPKEVDLHAAEVVPELDLQIRGGDAELPHDHAAQRLSWRARPPIRELDGLARPTRTA